MKLAIVLWAACGLYAWGTAMAEINYFTRLSGRPVRFHERVLIALLLLAGGIPAALSWAFLTEFNQHGWQLWERR